MSNTMTPPFRVSYPNVFKAKKNDLSGQDEYSIVALFPKDADLKPLVAAAEAAMKAEWGEDKKKWPANIRSPFRKQEERAKTDETTGRKVLPSGYTEGAVFLNLKSKQKPGLVNQKREDIIDDTEFYAGCWARATVSCYAYDKKGNRGVSFGLQNIQKVKDDEPLSGRTTAQDDFEALTETESGSSASDLFG